MSWPSCIGLTRGRVIPTDFNNTVTADVVFGFYRIKEDLTEEPAPISLGEVFFTIPNLNDVLDSVDGGSQLKDGVKNAFILMAKQMGLV
jgi:hypothetical protein